MHHPGRPAPQGKVLHIRKRSWDPKTEPNQEKRIKKSIGQDYSPERVFGVGRGDGSEAEYLAAAGVGAGQRLDGTGSRQ